MSHEREVSVAIHSNGCVVIGPELMNNVLTEIDHIVPFGEDPMSFGAAPALLELAEKVREAQK